MKKMIQTRSVEERASFFKKNNNKIKLELQENIDNLIENLSLNEPEIQNEVTENITEPEENILQNTEEEEFDFESENIVSTEDHNREEDEV